MIDGIFPHQIFKNSVAEMWSIITNYRSGGAKSGEDVLFEKFDNHFVVIRLSRHSFYPLRDTTTKMNWLPKELGNGPMKSIPQTSKILTSRIGFRGTCLFLKFFQFSDNLRITCKNDMSLWTKWASRTHFVEPSLQSCGDRSVLYMQGHGKSWAHSSVPPLVCIV